MSRETIKKILIVEDEVLIAIVSKQTIQKLGYTVTLANSGSEAIEIVTKDESIDLILMDIDLGKGMDGTKAAEIILKEKEIPILFLSSRTEPEIVEKTERITSFGYVVKGSSATVLDASIKMAFKLFDAKQKTESAKEKLEATLEALPDTLFELDRTGKFVDCHSQNQSFPFSSSQMIGKRIGELFSSKITNIYTSALNEAFEKGFANGKQFELLVDGKARWFEISVSCKMKFSSESRFIVLNRDITDRKQMVEEIKASETRLHQAMHVAQLGIWEWDIVTDETSWYGSMFQIYGVKPEEFTKKGIEYLNYIREDYREIQNKYIADSFKKGVTEVQLRSGENLPFDTTKLCIVRPDGTEAFILGDAVAVVDEKGSPKRMLGVLVDITERLRTENSGNESDQKFRALFEQAAVGVAQINSNTGEFTLINQEYCDIVGYRDEMSKSTFQAITHPDDLREDMENMRLLLLGEINSFTMDKRYIHKNGSIVWVNLTVSSLWKKGDKPSFHIAVVKNITKDKVLQEALQKSEERFRLISDLSPNGIYLTDKMGDCIYVNRKWSEISGLSLEEAKGSSGWVQGIHPEDRQLLIDNWNQLIAAKGKWGKEYRFQNKEGIVSWVYGLATEYADKEGEISGYLGVVNDITERKRFEEFLLQATKSLEESEKKFEAITMQSSDGIALSDLDGNYSYVNPAFCKMTGYSEIELLKMKVFDLKVKDLTGIFFISKSEMEGVPIQLELKRKDGLQFTTEIIGKLIQVDSKNFILEIVRDITERKIAEEKIQSLLVEKDLILKEVHHRIKNNISIIHSLLSIQKEKARDTSVIEILEDAENRLQSMMVLYSKLYDSTSYNEISVKDYISTLVEQVVRNFPLSESVVTQTKVEEFILDSKRLSTLGIIINELITNCMKYAFTNVVENAWILVTASIKNNIILVSVQDNGKGISEEINFKSTSGFGLTMVGLLAKQLGGTVEINRNQGTQIILEFEI